MIEYDPNLLIEDQHEHESQDYLVETYRTESVEEKEEDVKDDEFSSSPNLVTVDPDEEVPFRQANSSDSFGDDGFLENTGELEANRPLQLNVAIGVTQQNPPSTQLIQSFETDQLYRLSMGKVAKPFNNRGNMNINQMPLKQDKQFDSSKPHENHSNDYLLQSTNGRNLDSIDSRRIDRSTYQFNENWDEASLCNVLVSHPMSNIVNST